MSVRVQHGNEPTLYYVTYTCYDWLHLFSITNSFDLVYKWFDYLKNNSAIKVAAFTIMPNHVHAILFFPDTNYNLNQLYQMQKDLLLMRL